MATVIFIKEGRQNRSAMRAVINYCQQEYKTFDSKSKRRLVSGVNCDGENTYREFMATKKVYGKDNGIFFYHYAQSFSPTEKITPEKAHKIALECKDETQILSELGVCYVMFFYHNPLYFDFLFSRKSIQIRLSSDNSDIPPFELFRRTAKNVLGKMGISEENVRYKTTAMWALVHGLAALSAMPNIDIVWESEVRAIINSVDISDIKES